MFWKKKKKSQPTVGLVDDSRETVYDFCLRSSVVGYESYRPVEYMLNPKLDDLIMRDALDYHINELFAGNVDDGNADMLDALVFSAAREALPELNRQRVNHRELMRRLIIRADADLKSHAARKAECERELLQMQAEYETTLRMLKKYESCEEEAR